jgi:hypothetical protein
VSEFEYLIRLDCKRQNMKNMTLTKLDGFSAYQGYRYTHRFLEGFSRGMGKGTGIFTHGKPVPMG